MALFDVVFCVGVWVEVDFVCELSCHFMDIRPLIFGWSKFLMHNFKRVTHSIVLSL